MLINAPKRIAPDVAWYRVSHVNIYMIGRPGTDWVLVDTGPPGHAHEVHTAAEARHGKLPPAAIVLTHGHFDHSGNALVLAREWKTPVYAHRLELPYLSGRSPYPPQDLLLGGYFGAVTAFRAISAQKISKQLEELPTELPAIPDWQWIHTPGHSPGHISLFRESDRTLIAGDAVATVRLESLREILKANRELSAGPVQFNCDWAATVDSMRRLAALQPSIVAAGHGVPMDDPDIAERLTGFAKFQEPPEAGRYTREPARTDETGIVSLPPRPPLDWMKFALRLPVVGAAAAGALIEAAWRSMRRPRLQ